MVLSGNLKRIVVDPLGLSAAAIFMSALVIAAQAQVYEIRIPAQCNDNFDNTGIIAAAILSAPPTGAHWVMPAGRCRYDTININKPGVFEGQGSGQMLVGNSTTELVTTTPGGGVIVNSSGVKVKGLALTSSLPAASRTAAGLKLVNAQKLVVEDVMSIGHKYGYWIQQGVARFDAWAIGNASHGFYFDSTEVPQGQYFLLNAQSISNGGDGFFFLGGVGIEMVRPIAAFNGGAGIRFANLGERTIQDVYISHEEISGNVGAGIDIGNCVNCVNINVGAGVIEGSFDNGVVRPVPGINVGQYVYQVNLSGFHIHYFGVALLLNGTIGTVTGIIGSGGNRSSHIELGPNSSKYIFSGVSASALFGQTPVGLMVDPGAGYFVATGVDLTAASVPLVGGYPIGTRVTASPGLADR